MSEKRSIPPAQLSRARRFIGKLSQGKDEHWLGIAPSHLADGLSISYERAIIILMELEEAGFIYDNGHGAHYNLEDGRRYATRYSMKERQP